MNDYDEKTLKIKGKKMIKNTRKTIKLILINILIFYF